MSTAANNKPLLGADNNALVAILAINLVAYVILGLIKMIYYLESLSLEQFNNQIFQPLLLSQSWMNTPWSLLSYNWVHDGFWILVGNMIWFSVFSYFLQLNGANKHIFPLYFYGGIFGAFGYVLMGQQSPLFGAGVSVTCVIIATVSLFPRHKFLVNLAGGIPLWILGIVYILLQGFSLSHASLATAIVTLLGGMAGFFYVFLLKKDKDLGNWMHQLVHLLNNSLAPKS